MTDSPSEQTSTIVRTRVPAALASVPATRRWLAEQLASAPDEVRQTATLLTSELVTNAVLHAATDVTVTLHRNGGGLRVEVADESTQLPVEKRYGDDAATGRGLFVVSTLADSWGAGRRDTGKVVWFELGRRAAATGEGEPREPTQCPPAPGLVAVALVGVPVEALMRTQAEYDGLFREFRFVVESDPDVAGDAIQGRLVALVDELGTHFQGFTSGAEVEWRNAVDGGLDHADLHFDLPPEIGAVCARYDRLLDEADDLCRAGALMTLAATPEVVAVRKWVLDEFVRQSVGGSPVRWSSSTWAKGLE